MKYFSFLLNKINFPIIMQINLRTNITYFCSTLPMVLFTKQEYVPAIPSSPCRTITLLPSELKKWTVHVTSSEPLAKMPRFTTVPLKALFDISLNQKTIIFKFDFSLRCVSTFLNYKKQWRNNNFFKLKKRQCLPHFLSNEDFKWDRCK